MWGLAALASLLFPGVGQAYARRLRPAIIWAAAGLVPILVLPWWAPALALALAVRVAAAIDAAIRVYRRADAPGWLEGAAFVAGGWVVVLVLTRLFVTEFFKIPSSSMTPTLLIGDHIYVNKLVSPERGDVVVFVHPIGRDYVKRIVAGGGDTVAVRQGVLYVNGVAARQRSLGPARYDDYYDMEDEWHAKTVNAYVEHLGERTHRIFRQDLDAPFQQDYPRPKDAVFNEDGDPCQRGELMGEPVYRQQAMTLTADGTACRVPPGMFFMLGDNRDNANDSRSWGAVPAEKITGRVVGIWWSSTDPDGMRWSRIGNID